MDYSNNILFLNNPGSKLNLIDYLYIYKHQNLDKNEIYRFLDTLSLNLKDNIEQCIFEYTSRAHCTTT